MYTRWRRRPESDRDSERASAVMVRSVHQSWTGHEPRRRARARLTAERDCDPGAGDALSPITESWSLHRGAIGGRPRPSRACSVWPRGSRAHGAVLRLVAEIVILGAVARVGIAGAPGRTLLDHEAPGCSCELARGS